MAKRKKRPLRWYVAWTVVYFFLLASIITLFTSLPIWRISGIEVENASMLNPQDIISIAGIPLGDNIFFISLSKPRFNMERVIQLDKVEFIRQLPNKIIIKVYERQPFATAVIGDLTVVIDNAGVIIWQSRFKPLTGSRINLVPSISGVSELPVVKGLKKEQVFEDYKLDPQIAKAISETFTRLGEFIPQSKMNLEMKNINDINLMIEDVITLKIGDLENIEKKVADFQSILKEIGGKWNEIEYIDVRFPDYPAVKFRR